MSQIDWHAAFVGRTAKFDNSNIISATLVILATFSGSILFSVLYPLLIIVPFIIFGIMPSSSVNREEKKLFNDVEYRPITVAKVDESEEFDLDVTRGELNLFENETLFIGSAFKTGCQLFMLQGLRVRAFFLNLTKVLIVFSCFTGLLFNVGLYNSLSTFNGLENFRTKFYLRRNFNIQFFYCNSNWIFSGCSGSYSC